MNLNVKEHRDNNGNKKKKRTDTRIRCLYVCPYAHYPGHFAAAAIQETQALAEAGVDIQLLTFGGVIGDAKIKVPHIVVFTPTNINRPVHYFIKLLRKWTISRWIVMFFETLATLSRAVILRGKKEVDIIHLRDGEPFLFLSHLLSLPFRNYCWVISLTASNIYPPKPKTFKQFVYTLGVRFVNSSIWKPLYRISLARNGFVFLTQNETAQRGYDSYLGGIFEGKVIYLPLGSDRVGTIVEKNKARRKLKLPLDRPIFLSFGAPHSGKDLDTIFNAASQLPNACLVHAGSQAFSLGSDTTNLAEKYGEPNKVIIRDQYITEEEKPYYFFAADAVILSYTRKFLSTSSLLWEACRFGIPVIASDNGQLGDLVETYNVGLLFEAEEFASLRKAMAHFVKLKPKQIDLFRRKCKRFANEFSLDKWAHVCVEIYQSVLSTVNQ